jgi:hypothetical protein
MQMTAEKQDVRHHSDGSRKMQQSYVVPLTPRHSTFEQTFGPFFTYKEPKNWSFWGNVIFSELGM